MRHLLASVVLGVAVATATVQSSLAQPAVTANAPVPPSQVVLAQKVVDAARISEAGAITVNYMVNTIMKSFTVGKDMDPQFLAFIDRIFHREANKIVSQVRPIYAEIYAKTFDEKQLSDLLVFYQSPTGRMLVEKGPDLARASHDAVQPFIPRMQRDMIQELFDHFCEIKHCTADESQKLAAAKASLLARIDQAAAQAQK